jgi:hypothetical protein
MIHIEKLSLNGVGKYTWQTFVDNFLGTKETRKHFLEEERPKLSRAYINSQILTPHLFTKLSNITLGKYFGFVGVDINLLLSDQINIENLVIEISVDNLNSLSNRKLKLLLEKFPIILNDFEEGGNLYGKEDLNLVKFLSERNIKPKQLFLVGSGVQYKDYPDLNIYKIHYDYWMIISATISEKFSNALFDSQYKQSLLDKLALDIPRDFCIIPIFKPRVHRIKLLAYLESLSLLEKCDWSLAFNYTPETDNYRSLKVKSDVASKLSNFLNKYNFPKFLSRNSGLDWTDIISPSMPCFNQYNYYLSVETFLGDELLTPMGSCGFVTEKTFKGFLTGAAPLIYGPKEINDHLSKIGFKTLTADIDISNYREVGDFLNILSNNTVHERELIQHNFDLITNKDYLTDQIVQPLNKIAELINSIRR